MKKNKTIINLMYQGVYQLVKTLLPLITIPIVAHSLGAGGVGQYSFANSIVQYFLLIAALGVPLYGTKVIAERTGNPEKLSRAFWDIETFSIILSGITFAVAVLIGLVWQFNNVYFVQLLLIIGTGLDVSWLFMGVEDFKKISLANLAVTLTTFVLILLLVNNQDDVLVYAGIMTGGIVATQLILWLFVGKYVARPDDIKISEIIFHLRRSFTFFIPQIGIVFYTNLNKTMLGMFAPDKSMVGMFANGILMTSAIITLVGTIDTVLLPKITKLVIHGETVRSYEVIRDVLNLQIYITLPVALGLGAVADKFVPWFFGSTFKGLEMVLPIISMIVIVIPAGMTLSKQFLIPANRVKDYNLTVYAGAVISVILNVLLIPIWGIIGAALVSVIVETLIWAVRVYDFKKKTRYSYAWRSVLVQLIISVLMCAVVKCLFVDSHPSALVTVFQVVIGGSIYLIGTTLLRVNPFLTLFVHRNKSKTVT